MSILRDNQPKTISIPVVVHHKDIQQLAELVDLKTSIVPRLGFAGLELNDKTQGLMPGLRSPSGVVVAVMVPESRDVDTGLRVGDVIYTLNRERVDSIDKTP